MAARAGTALQPGADHRTGAVGRTWTTLLDWGVTNGVDWLIGRRLPGLVSRLGLGRAALASTDVQNIRAPTAAKDTSSCFSLRCVTIDHVLASGALDASTFDAASALLDDPDYWTQCWMIRPSSTTGLAH